MTAAARQASPALWSVGSYEDEHGRRVPWRISHEEIGRDIGVAVDVLTDLGLAGKRLLWCSMLSQAGQFWPYLCGTVMAGSRLSCADSTYGEAMRVSMFLRLMDYDAVFGVTEALLDGIIAILNETYDSSSEGYREWLTEYMSPRRCPECSGLRLRGRTW